MFEVLNVSIIHLVKKSQAAGVRPPSNGPKYSNIQTLKTSNI
jgi:hypothetical protein